jgi:NTE family protein
LYAVDDDTLADGLAMAHRAFVALSGGGAKGVVHIGALKALEERDVSIAGVSGTSAGAIIAALVASGFRSTELVDPETGLTIMDQLRDVDPKLRKATDLFGGGWPRIWLFRMVSRLPLPLAPLLIVGWLIPLLTMLLISYLVPTHAWMLITIGWAVAGLALFAMYRSLVGGLAHVGRFRNALATLLQRKLFPDEPGRIVTMRDFGIEGRPALKVVSANLSRRSLQLFSAERTPDTPVADAVAASICLPVIFRPWMIGDELHVDGGIVSNLPAWPFDEERELDPGALTIAVEIESRPDRHLLGRFNWVAAAVPTALFGSGELNLRIAGQAEQLALPTTFELLDFDRGFAAVRQEVRDVALAAGVRLDKRLFRLPEIYRNACQVAQALALDGLGLKPGGRGAAARVRVAVGRLERGYVHSLRLSHSVGFDDDTDELMLLPLEGSVAGAAWRRRDSMVEAYPLAPDFDLPGEANRLRRKSRWSEVKWVMCIPILDEDSGEPRLLVQLDGNTELPPNADTAGALEGVEEAVKDFFNLVLHELKELEDDHGT